MAILQKQLKSWCQLALINQGRDSSRFEGNLRRLFKGHLLESKSSWFEK